MEKDQKDYTWLEELLNNLILKTGENSGRGIFIPHFFLTAWQKEKEAKNKWYQEWKKVLNQQGTQVCNPRETFRLTAQWGYLEDQEVWFNFGKERNLTSHTYQENILTAIYNLLPKFLKEFEKLITKLQEKNF